MPHDDSSWRPDSDPPSHIRAARAQVEAARRRQQSLAVAERPLADAPLPHKSLPGYTLLREIHRGGQGVVYLAVQHSTDRQVAIKLFNCGPFLGSSVAALARFEREVEALTLLKHPNIVTIHDCGRDDDHVFMVMDFVNGRPLDAHVGRDGETAIRDILALFAKVCDGVNAAHLRGVIHRDVKPANILVDERGEPHVLDFGLAKLVNNSSLSAAPTRMMTETGQFVGSLPWASPEQAEGRSDELDIRTDVYSLGIVLYQLLTGRFPYPVAGRLVEVVRHIVHTDPIRPSAIVPEIDRELETILLKCLAKEPDRRYQSAGEVARDLRRYLADEPIEARRDSLTYLMTKRLARYRAAAIAAAAILLILSSALVVSLSLWRRAERQRGIAQTNATAAQTSAERADREAAQARAVVEFMREILTSAEPERQGADVRLIQVLAAASASAPHRFAAHPAQEAQVRQLLAETYEKLGMWNEAEIEYGAALALWQGHAGPDDPATLHAEMNWAGMALNLSKGKEAERILRGLIPRMIRVLGPDHRDTLMARRNLASTLIERGQFDEAESILGELRPHPALVEDDLIQMRIVQSLVDLAQGRRAYLTPADWDPVLAEEEALTREWVERAMRVKGPFAGSTLQARVMLAEVTGVRGRDQEAADACRELLDSTKDRLRDCHEVRTWALAVLANSLSAMGQTDEPARLYLRRIDCLREVTRPDNPAFLSALYDALPHLERGGLGPEGESLAREVTTAFQKFAGSHSDMVFVPDLYLARFISMQGRLSEAEPLFQSLLATEAQVSDTHTRTRFRLYYGGHLTSAARFEDAEQQLQLAAASVNDPRPGMPDVHPDDVTRAFITLYQAWNKPEKLAEYQQLQPATSGRAAHEVSAPPTSHHP